MFPPDFSGVCVWPSDDSALCPGHARVRDRRSLRARGDPPQHRPEQGSARAHLCPLSADRGHQAGAGWYHAGFVRGDGLQEPRPGDAPCELYLAGSRLFHKHVHRAHRRHRRRPLLLRSASAQGGLRYRMDDAGGRVDAADYCCFRRSTRRGHTTAVGGAARVTRRLALTGLVTCLVLMAALGVSAATNILAAPSASTASPPTRPAGRWQDATLEEYRRHLVALKDLTQACAKARDLKTCDPTLVGLDDRLPAGAPSSDEFRLIRYGWLRILFSRAEEPDKAQKAPDSGRLSGSARKSLREIPPTTSQLLVDAQARLAHDLAQSNRAAAPLPSHVEERDTMKQVLAGREFSNLQPATESDTALERFGNWLNRLFAKFEKLRARSAWVGRTLVWGFFGAIAVGLAWGLLRVERRWRIRLVTASAGLVSEAVSVRDW